MAHLGALKGPWELAGRTLPRRVLRNVRLMVPISIALICGSFAAVALLSMRLDRVHAMDQAAHSEQQRAADLAVVAGASLDRLAAAGLGFAHNPGTQAADPAIRNIAVFQGGAPRAVLNAQSALPPQPNVTGSRNLFRFGPQAGLALRDGDRIVTVLFDPAALVPPALMRNAELIANGALLAGDPMSGDGIRQEHTAPGWPLIAATQLDDEGALASWRALLPFYLFVILGPAVAGGWLAALFVGTFERHEKAAHAIRALKTTRPVEARLMVRLANAERASFEAARSKAEFIAHMSHELRTPLNAVIGFSEVIAQGLFGPPGHSKYVEYAHDIAEAGRGLHTRIGDILEFANIEAGRHPLKPEWVDLAVLASACVEEHKGRAFSRRIQLDTGSMTSAPVKADPLAVRRILSNLISNALAYTKEGGVVLVDVRAEEGAGVALVRDSGAGFSREERARAGRPFQRFDRTGHVTGAGLGLAIAMELARRMDGAMRLSSLPGDGSVMELRLPNARTDV
ncbi:MAG TPA: HAMP domain-containing sensor histidine kinase [Rhizomicrobium sp.]|jgi:signal transduction histidine kinase